MSLTRSAGHWSRLSIGSKGQPILGNGNFAGKNYQGPAVLLLGNLENKHN